MSITFKSVASISRREDRSVFRPLKKIYKNKCFEYSKIPVREDDFPPLRKIYSQESFHLHSTYSRRNFSNGDFLGKCCDRSFEEMRWSHYLHNNTTNYNLTYSKCLGTKSNNKKKQDINYCEKTNVNIVKPSLNNERMKKSLDEFNFLLEDKKQKKDKDINNLNKEDPKPLIALKSLTNYHEEIKSLYLSSQKVSCPSQKKTNFLPRFVETPVRSIKGRSVLTINQPINFQRNIQIEYMKDTTSKENNQQFISLEGTQRNPLRFQELVKVKNCYLKENLSRQFECQLTLNSISPFFDESNLHADFFDYSVSRTNQLRPVVRRKKDFKARFSPYSRGGAF
ncbi:hypothetical protein ABEB36_008829 [Hypothenemus hampei]|uniref:Uncharacterized protein n=1 Tax=Hypothenemus hampei TaxID=57062 RepID=A0ABD1EN73_HYPHA